MLVWHNPWGYSISCPCSVHWLFQVGLQTSRQGISPWFFLSCSMCLEARLLLWWPPGSLSDSSRVLNRSTQPMWAWLKMSEIMVDSKSSVVLQLHPLPSLSWAGSDWFSLLLVHFLPYSLQYHGRFSGVLQVMVENVFAFWHCMQFLENLNEIGWQIPL